MNRAEVQAITKVLAEYRAPCRVLAPPRTYQTPRTTVYVLDRGPGVRFSAIRRAEVELEDALTALRGEATPIRIIPSPPAIIVPRQDPRLLPIAPLLRKVKDSPPGGLRIAWGEHYNHAASSSGRGVTPQLLYIDLRGPTTPHVLVAGTTGAGKTGVLKNAVLSGALANSPTDTVFVLFDPKGRDLPILETLPHLAAPIFTQPGPLLGGLRGLVAEMEGRNERYNQMIARLGAYQAALDAERAFSPRIVAVVDEVAELIDRLGEEAGTLIKRLLQQGRGLGIHLLLGTQKPESSFIGGISLGNLPVRACGAVAQMEHGKYATGIPGKVLGAHKLTGKGDFLLTLNAAKVFAFQAGYIQEGEEASLTQGILKQWQGQRATWRLSYQTVAMPKAQPEERRRKVDAVHEDMVEFLVAHTKQQGDLPSTYEIKKLFEERHKRQLNPNTAAMLRERTQQRLH